MTGETNKNVSRLNYKHDDVTVKCVVEMWSGKEARQHLLYPSSFVVTTVSLKKKVNTLQV